MNRRIGALLAASAILVGVYAAAPAEAHTSSGLSCAITKTWYEGMGHGGVPHYGVAVRMTNNRTSWASIRAGVLTSYGATLWTRTLVVGPGTYRTATVTSASSSNQLAHCHG